jgi:antagonist of KipI
VIEVLAPGLLTTVQDLGRPGLRHLGVVHAGAADVGSHVLAQLLVGNPAFAAGLEVTWLGPRLRFHAAAAVALAGGAIEARCGGAAVPALRPVRLPEGAVLELGRVVRGARVALAVAGGIDVEPVLGSRSTDRRAGFGGYEGRPLRSGDVLGVGRPADPAPPTGHDPGVSAPAWSIHPLDAFEEHAVLRVLPGADFEALAPSSRAALLDGEWRVGTDSDRMGVTLDGPALGVGAAPGRVSAPVLPGCVQVPPGGRPVLLGVDAQTVGGYPVVAHVIRADLDRAMQLRPGDVVRLGPVDERHARAAWRTRLHALHERAAAIAARRARGSGA